MEINPKSDTIYYMSGTVFIKDYIGKPMLFFRNAHVSNSDIQRALVHCGMVIVKATDVKGEKCYALKKDKEGRSK